MRLLQLATGPGELLDLHPNVTVVQGLDDDHHRVLVSAVAGLARAEASPGGGLLEAHGVLFDLQPELLGLLDVTGDDLDPIVRPGDLPTQPLTVDARELRTREHDFNELLARISLQAERQSLARGELAAAAAAVEQARRARAEAEAGAGRRIEQVDELTRRLDQLAEQHRRAEEQLAEVGPAREAAEFSLAEVQARTAEVRAAAEAASARHAVLQAERDAAAADLDPASTDAVTRAQDRLTEVMAAVQAERDRAAAAEHGALFDDEASVEAEPVEERLARVAARLDELDRTLVAMAPVEVAEVAEALAVLQGGDSLEQVPSLEALALADELDSVGAVLGHDEVGDDEIGLLTDSRARLDDARQALLEAEHAVRNPELDRAEVLLLEAAHEDLLDAIEKADRRFAGTRTRERVTELRASEQVILDRLGFTSYSDYMMGNSRLHVDPVKEAALVSARAALAAAEAEWRRLERTTDEALARGAALDRRRGLLEQARRLLGAPVALDEVQGALRALRVPVVTAADSARRLHAALAAIDLDLGDEDLDQVELEVIAEAWLSEAAGVDERRQVVVAERDPLHDERERLELELAATAPHAVEADRPDPEVARTERVAAARADVEEAENRWLVHELAEERLTRVLAELEDAAEAAHRTADAAAGADAEIASARAAFAPLADSDGQLREELARISAAEAEAGEALRALVDDRSLDPDVLEAEIEACEARHREAVDAIEAETRALEILDAEGQAAAVEIERLQDIVAAEDTGTATAAEELEWYLLARLAAQRSVSVAGSVPLLLDDALRGLAATEVGYVLDRLERMGEAVQVIVVSEDPLVAAWATDAGPGRAAVVRPGAA